MSFFKSSIGKKVTMSLTGLFLISFLVIHLIGNFQLLKADDGYAFNMYAKFMTTNPLIKTISYLLYASILFHAFMGLHLVFKNRASRQEKYAVANKSTSPWTSRYMGILGTLILVFIVVHMGDFWREYKFEAGFETKRYFVMENVAGESQTFAFDSIQELQANPALANLDFNSVNDSKFETYKDLYSEVKEAFYDPIYVLIYLISMLAILFHLWHGFTSAIQTLGISNKTLTQLIELKRFVVAVIIPLAFAAIPLYIYFTK